MRRRHLLDPSVAHHRNTVGHGQRLDLIVRDDHRRLVELVEDLDDLGPHRLAELDIEAAERLVQTGRVQVLTRHEHVGRGSDGEQIRDLSSDELIEVQVGSYLGEDDILRLDDVYHRHM